jgi:hypothetical protein
MTVYVLLPCFLSWQPQSGEAGANGAHQNHLFGEALIVHRTR